MLQTCFLKMLIFLKISRRGVLMTLMGNVLRTISPDIAAANSISLKYTLRCFV